MNDLTKRGHYRVVEDEFGRGFWVEDADLQFSAAIDDPFETFEKAMKAAQAHEDEIWGDEEVDNG